MAVFIELSTDPFEANYARLKSRNDPSVARSGRAGLSNVRRPLRGMEIKEDTYASLKVIRADGSEVPFLDSSSASGTSTSYSNFILQSVQETRMEKHQIIETFGDAYIYFFGEAPRFLDVQAVLLNSQDFNWQAEWWANWENTLRGSKSVENGARTYLFYDDNVVEGYMLMSAATVMSTEPFMVSMTFRMFVSSYRNVSFVGDPDFPVSEAVNLPPDISLTDADAYSKVTALYNTDDRYNKLQTSLFSNPAYTSTPQTFGAAGNLVDALRQGARASAFPTSVQATIDSLVASNTMGLGSADVLSQLISKPLRGKIADNTDEYTGSGGITTDYLQDQLPEVYDPRVRSQLEVDNLFHSAISWMACFGANINSFNLMAQVGLGVSFGVGAGVGIGLGTGVNSGATFGAVPYGGSNYVSVAAGFGFSSAPSAGGSAASISALNSNKSPLFSTGAAAVNPLASGQAALGDPAYGYPSPYGGPGFGQAGYGDYGGLGFGSSHGSLGDPGFLAPDKFTFAGVPGGNGALERLQAGKRGYGAGFGGVGAADSYAGGGAGASVSIGGKVSAFSVSAVPGTLDASGHSLLNPYAVSCNNNLLDVRVSLGALL